MRLIDEKILLLALVLLLSVLVCSCSFYEDFNVSEIMSNVESYIEYIAEETAVKEIDFGKPFIYNTYYDSGYTALNEKQRGIYENLYLIALQMPTGYVRLCDNYDGFYTDVSIAYNAIENIYAMVFLLKIQNFKAVRKTKMFQQLKPYSKSLRG